MKDVSEWYVYSLSKDSKIYRADNKIRGSKALSKQGTNDVKIKLNKLFFLIYFYNALHCQDCGLVGYDAV
jgi:hypothetical protein